MDAAGRTKKAETDGGIEVVAQVLHKLPRLFEIVDGVKGAAVSATDEAGYMRGLQIVKEVGDGDTVVGPNLGPRLDDIVTGLDQKLDELGADPALAAEYDDPHVNEGCWPGDLICPFLSR
jgi:hypothetical protein